MNTARKNDRREKRSGKPDDIDWQPQISQYTFGMNVKI
jgi:hypothetical protein